MSWMQFLATIQFAGSPGTVLATNRSAYEWAPQSSEFLNTHPTPLVILTMCSSREPVAVMAWPLSGRESESTSNDVRALSGRGREGLR